MLHNNRSRVSELKKYENSHNLCYILFEFLLLSSVILLYSLFLSLIRTIIVCIY